MQNSAQKTKENDVKITLSSLVYITPIRLLFCISTGERERIFVKKEKIIIIIKIGQKRFYNQVNDKER